MAVFYPVHWEAACAALCHLGAKSSLFSNQGNFLRMGERWSRLDESGLYFVPFPVLVSPKTFLPLHFRS